jgi:DNA-binding transcriptional regulator YbjK
MSSRRNVLLDAAIQVLGDRGIKALTHRAVDAQAGVSAGSTSNYFSTRAALLAAVVERFAERERQNFEDLAVAVAPTSPAALGRALAAGVRDSTRQHRALTLARYALLVESANNPVLRERMAATGVRVNAWGATWLRVIGSRDPEHHVQVLGNYVTGLVLHELAMPDPDFDPTDTIVALLEGLVADEPQHRRSPSYETTLRR